MALLLQGETDIRGVTVGSDVSVPSREKALDRKWLVHTVRMTQTVSRGTMIQQLILGQGRWKRRSSN